MLTDVLVKVSKFKRQKMYRPEGDSNPQPSDSWICQNFIWTIIFAHRQHCWKSVCQIWERHGSSKKPISQLRYFTGTGVKKSDRFAIKDKVMLYTAIGFEGSCFLKQVKYFYITSMITMVVDLRSWWRHQMEIFSALLAICAGNSPVTCEFPTQRPVTRSFDVFFDLRLNKRLSKQSRGWWFETLLHPLWRHGCISRMLESYCHRSLQYTSYFCILYEYPHPHPANIYY